MFSTGAFSFRRRAQLAISLAGIGGYTNVVTLLSCGYFTTHHTGSITSFGRHLAEGSWSQAVFFAFIPFAFVCGAAATSFLAERARRSRRRSRFLHPIGLEMALLTLFAIGIEHHDHVLPDEIFSLYWMCGIAAMSMGVQNALITRISGSVVRTTHLTGVLTDFGLEVVQYLYRAHDLTHPKHRSAPKASAAHLPRPSRQRLALLTMIVVAFTAGVIVGTFVFHRLPRFSMLPPVSLLGLLVFSDWVRPRAEIRRKGDVTEQIRISGRPPDVDVKSKTAEYVIHVPHVSRTVGPPDFLFWTDQINSEVQTVVIEFSPYVSFDHNSSLDFAAAVGVITQPGRRLVLRGLTDRQREELALHLGLGIFQSIELIPSAVS